MKVVNCLLTALKVKKYLCGNADVRKLLKEQMCDYGVILPGYSLFTT